MAFQIPENRPDFSCEFCRINPSTKQLWSLVAALITLQVLRHLTRASCMIFGPNKAPSRVVRSLADRTELRIMDILFSLLRLDECQSNGYRDSSCITTVRQQAASSTSALGELDHHLSTGDSTGKLVHEVESLVVLNAPSDQEMIIDGLSRAQNTQPTTGNKSQEPMRTNKSLIIPSAVSAPPETMSMATKATPQMVNSDSFSGSIYSSSSHEPASSDRSLSMNASGTALVTAGNVYAELILKEHPFGSLSRHTSIQVAVPEKARSPSHCHPGGRDLAMSCDSSLSSKFSSSYPGNNRHSSY
jgi:hypothetical protein